MRTRSNTAASGRLSFHAFTELGWPDAHHGVWRNETLVPPRTVGSLQPWVELAQLAERGCLDSLFFADAVGMGGFVPDDLDAEVRDGRMLLYDPAVVVGALAAATENVGFMFTSSILQEHPFSFARKLSTLDHFTGGRIGWNIVTSYSPNAARNYGLEDLPDRDERYRWADEYVDVAYRLWEGSWEDGALVRDAASGNYVDPALVHTIDYTGERYRVQGPHLTDPSPQRTPVLVQAGGSPAGRAFAARNAEVQFMAESNVDSMGRFIADVRELAVAAGRAPGDISFMVSTSFVIGSTEEEARRKARERDESVDLDDLAAGLSTSIGVDLFGIDPDTPVTRLKSPNPGGMQGVLDALLEVLPQDRDPTLRELLLAQLSRSRVVGAPEQIADRLEQWRAVGIGGVAIGMPLRPASVQEFVDHAIPVLQERGLAQREYEPGTLRQRLKGYGDRLPDRHPAARYRR